MRSCTGETSFGTAQALTHAAGATCRDGPFFPSTAVPNGCPWREWHRQAQRRGVSALLSLALVVFKPSRRRPSAYKRLALALPSGAPGV